MVGSLTWRWLSVYDEPYLCPACRENRTSFQLVYKLAQEVRKDPETGRIQYAAAEWEAVRRGQGLELEVRCLLCSHVADERRFIETARRREALRFQRRAR